MGAVGAAGTGCSVACPTTTVVAWPLAPNWVTGRGVGVPPGLTPMYIRILPQVKLTNVTHNYKSHTDCTKLVPTLVLLK